jgi:hypothetical protein
MSLSQEAHIQKQRQGQDELGYGCRLYITISFSHNYKMAFLGGIAGLCGLSDDIFNISAKARLLIYLSISGGSVFLCGGNNNFLIVILWMLFIIGALNVYNFMDGINGMLTMPMWVKEKLLLKGVIENEFNKLFVLKKKGKNFLID